MNFFNIINKNRNSQLWNAGYSFDDGFTDNYSGCDIFSPQSQSSIDSGVDSGMSGSSPTGISTNVSFTASNVFNDFNETQFQNNPSYGLQQPTVSIAYPSSYSSPNHSCQLVPNNAFNHESSLMNVVASFPAPTPHLEIVEEPTDKPFRFRYKSEMHGTHGSLMGVNTKKTKRTYPTVALRNFNFPMKVYIRCSLFQVPSEGRFKRSPHSHKLVIRKGDREESDPHEVEVSNVNNFTATFQGMGVIHTAKKNIKEELYRKMYKEQEFERKKPLTPSEIAAIERDAEKQSKEMNLNQVCLCFQAFVRNEAENTMERVCEPVFSCVINNMKSALTGELRITRMSNYTSPVTGGEEIFMLVEKVCKNNIKVKFFELYDNGASYWEGFGVFNESDVHHQYGIVLRTPPYRKTSIESSVDVMVQLYRPSDGAASEPIEFRYKSTLHAGAKRPRRDSRDMIPTVLDSHNSSTPAGSTSNGEPSHSCMSVNSFTGHSSNNNQQHFDDEESLFSHDNLLGYFGTVTASELSFSYSDLKGLPSSPEELCNLLDIEVGGESMLQIDSVCVEKPYSRKTSEFSCSLIDKLRVLIRLFKKNFDEKKLGDMINTLIEEQNETGENILLDLIQHGSIEEIKELTIILVKYKLKTVLNSLNDLDQNCLQCLVIARHHKLLKIFLNLGVNVNQVDAFGETALHLAIGDKDIESVQELLEGAKDLELNGFNDNGLTPLHIAVTQDNLPITKCLIKAGADLLKKSPQSGNNVLHLAVSRNQFNINMITHLIECNEMLLYQENNAGMNALQVAASHQPETLVQYLSTHYVESYTSAVFLDRDDDESESGDDEYYSTLFDSNCLKLLCKIFNAGDKWKSVLMIAELEDKIEEWQDYSNPAKTLLIYLEKKGKTLNDLHEIFDLLDEKEAANAIDELLARKLNK